MRYLLACILSVFLISACQAEPSQDKLVNSNIQLKYETVASGLEHPWAVAILPNNEFLVTERPGRLVLVNADGDVLPVQNTPQVYDRGQGGLLDVIITPDNTIYLSYAAADPADDRLANTEVVRAEFNRRDLRLENPEVVFVAEPKVEGPNHWGSRLLLNDQNHLYVTLGDRFDYRDQAQNPENHLGSVVRVMPDGTHAVYSYGHRNVQGMAAHPETGAIWTHEHGPKGGDEVNILKQGANYGWPNVSYGRRYSGREISETGEHAPLYTGPILHWTPSIAPSGMAFYQGNVFPEWQGDLLAGALAKTHLRRVKLNGENVIEQEILAADLEGRIRDVEVDSQGYIYVLTDDSNGKLIRISR